MPDLDLDPLAPRTPRLPHQRLGAVAPLAVSIALHVTLGLIAALIVATSSLGIDPRRADSITDQPPPDVQHLVFLAPERQPARKGGGGGGNRRPDPIRRAQDVGADTITLRVGNPPPIAPVTTSAAPAGEVPALPSVLLDAKPLATGLFFQMGLPSGGEMSGTSTGTGSGGGVGSGSGSGVGSGLGPGFGPGSGGGTGRGIYRAGAAVSAPRLIKEVKHKYTAEAFLKRIQGTVVLEAVVTSDGCASQIRVVRSLDAGLDEEAVLAVAQWRFEPGRLEATPVDVLVTILIDFAIR